jgi:hypothetical protein
MAVNLKMSSRHINLALKQVTDKQKEGLKEVAKRPASTLSFMGQFSSTFSTCVYRFSKF